MILFPELDADDAKRLNELIARELKNELMECETPSGSYDLGMLSDRVPPWVKVQHKDKADRIFSELALMASDGFEHELSPLFAHVLFRSWQAWRDVAGDHAAIAESETERHELNEYHELLEYYISEALPDQDFLSVEVFANAVLHGIDVMEEFGVAIEEYFELLPDDIHRDIERKLAAKPSGTEPSPGDDTGQDPDSE